jgi:cobalt-zinc-cadmium efflux system outer membrane protein
MWNLKPGVRRTLILVHLAACLCVLACPAVAQTSRIALDEALKLAVANNPSLKAARTQIVQGKAQEVTAGLRPNPLLSWDSQFVPIFNPSLFSTNTLDTLQQFDIGAGYLIERGGKRQRRLDAARDLTRVTQAQVDDAERALSFNVAQQFINVLLARSNLEFATEALNSFQKTVNINEDRYKSGDISKGDFLMIKVQLLQFQTDVHSARLAKIQALNTLRQLIGYEAVRATTMLLALWNMRQSGPDWMIWRPPHFASAPTCEPRNWASTPPRARSVSPRRTASKT